MGKYSSYPSSGSVVLRAYADFLSLSSTVNSLRFHRYTSFKIQSIYVPNRAQIVEVKSVPPPLDT
jgi:hypothetical protein